VKPLLVDLFHRSRKTAADFTEEYYKDYSVDELVDFKFEFYQASNQNIVQKFIDRKKLELIMMKYTLLY